ncbi:MAG TPA: 4Fe-4S dicluster domain-containing protein [Ktedonobacterales bacterium]
MIYIDFIDRSDTVATSPTLCMHCEDPLAPCAQVCPAQAILVSADGIVHQADETRCIGCQNCVFACPFGVPKFQISQQYMRKCNMCYDRTSQGKGPMCATVCPTQAIFYGTYEEFVTAGRTQQGAKPINQFQFGAQALRTRNYVVMTDQDETLDLMALTAEAHLGYLADIPAPAADRDVAPWVDARTAGIPTREAPPQPWTPRKPLTPEPLMPPHEPAVPEPEKTPVAP